MSQNWDNELLLPELKKRNKKAFEQMYESFYTKLSYFTFQLVKDQEITKDIVSETFAQCWKDIDSIKSYDHLKNYLYFVCRNKSINHLKSIPDSIDPSEIELSHEEHIEKLLMKSELVSQINKHIEELPEECRKVFTLIFKEGLSNKQIAEKLNITESTVRSHKSDGIRYIREKLKTLGLL